MYKMNIVIIMYKLNIFHFTLLTAKKIFSFVKVSCEWEINELNALNFLEEFPDEEVS